MLRSASPARQAIAAIAWGVAGLFGSTAFAQTPSHTPPAGAQHPHSGAQRPPSEPQFFVRINGQEISVAEYDRFAREAFRQKFYHGQPPEAEVQAMLRSVGQQLIDNVLLAAEAERRKIAPNKASVDEEIAKYEKQYANSENWKTQRETTIPRIRSFLEAKSRVDRLEAQVRDIPTPKEDAVRAFYKRSPDLFTEPEKVRVGVILLRVDPGAPSSAWEKAMTDAKGMHESLKKGANFGELAKLRSQDGSKDNGGDMGYLHRGMLAEEVHKEIDSLKPGQILAPIRILEGVAIFKLIDRQVAKLRPFDAVRERAEGLLRREEANKTWENFLQSLRAKAKVEIHPMFSEIMNPATPASGKGTPAAASAK